jgi:hypothetical protein
VERRLRKLEKKNNNTNGWDSGLIIIDRMKVVIPVKLLLVCNQIASKVDDNEFSIMTDIKEKGNSEVILNDSYYIPKQVVSPTYIEYQPDTYEHSVCIHRHPDGMNRFSGTDREYINQNFKLSILYTRQDGFVNGIYNHKIDDTCIIQLPVEISVDYNLEPLDITNIQAASALMISDRLLESGKNKEPKLEKFRNSKIDKPEEKDMGDLEDRVFMLEEAVYYNNLHELPF